MKAILIFISTLAFVLVGCNNSNNVQSIAEPHNQVDEVHQVAEAQQIEETQKPEKVHNDPSPPITVKQAIETQKLYIEPGFPTEIAVQFLFFKLMVEEGNKSEISKLIEYPFQRPNTLLKDSSEFIAYYDKVFDASFKQKLQEITLSQKDFIIKSDHYGIIGGKLWFNRHSGEITSLRYQSTEEIKIDSLQKASIKSRDHPSIAGWEKAIVRCETENFFVYVLEDPAYELSYVSWNKPKTTADEPNLNLKGGETERKGTMGGSTYSFKNGVWTYAIDERRLGPDGTNGYFLQVYKNGNLAIEEKAIKIFE